MARYVSALSFALLLAVFGIGSATKCYQCNSVSDPLCGEKYKAGDKYLVDCMEPKAMTYNSEYLTSILPPQLVQRPVPNSPKSCHKFVLMNNAVVRTCMEYNPSRPNATCELFDSVNKAASALDLGKALKACSACEKDACNGSGAIAASVPLATLALIASYLYYQH